MEASLMILPPYLACAFLTYLQTISLVRYLLLSLSLGRLLILTYQRISSLGHCLRNFQTTSNPSMRPIMTSLVMCQ
uniref:Uncharacterized protein n=1 Tax=Arundo donax TaxID=35708 RepID=A0A0A9CGP8_ARUDO